MDNNFIYTLDKASKALTKGDYAKAERLLGICLRRKPDNPVALLAMGTCHLKRGAHGHAVKYLRAAVEKGPHLSEAHNNLGVALRHIGDDDGARVAAEAGMRLAPDDPNIRSNLGSILLGLGEFAEAESHLRHGMKLDEKHPDCHWNLGLALLGQGKFREGWQEYDWGFRAGERPVPPFGQDYPEWLGEPLEGKTILTFGEQGIGDEILFSSYLPHLQRQAGHVLFVCHPRLQPIFARSFPGIECVGARKRQDWDWLTLHEIDYLIPLGSLGGQFPDAFPSGAYLRADAAKTEAWRRRFAGRRMIGVSWRGGSKKNAAEKRSMPLKNFHSFMAGVDAQWVSLQYGEVFEEVDRFRHETGVDLFHDLHAMEDYDETAALVAACDLVITVTTAVGHLAGALGKEAWVLVPLGAPWRWPRIRPNIAKHPFYPSICLLHQERRYDWTGVLDGVRNRLCRP